MNNAFLFLKLDEAQACTFHQHATLICTRKLKKSKQIRKQATLSDAFFFGFYS